MTDIKAEHHTGSGEGAGNKPNARSRTKEGAGSKRKCVSTACIACRRRKSKCDGNLPSCAACASVYKTPCEYDPSSDLRRKGVYRKANESTKAQNSTLQVLIEGILNFPEDEVFDLVRQIRTCDSLEDVAQDILARNVQLDGDEEDISALLSSPSGPEPPRFESELSGKLGELKLDNGAIQFLGGTSNLLYVDSENNADTPDTSDDSYASQEEAIRSWTAVTDETSLILHLLNMYFTWHYTYFTTLSRSLFFRDFLKGRPTSSSKTRTTYCTSLLVNSMLALGCHFTSWPSARLDPDNSATAGDHFFRECKRLMMINDEHEASRLPTVQALALMSVREAGCGREAKGWIWSGMSFRMAIDLGLPYEAGNVNLTDDEIDARKMTFWGCFLFDKCWSNYLGRPPQLSSDITVKKIDVFPQEDSEMWSPWTDSGLGQNNRQPSRTRAVALQISALCEISSDLLLSFYRPNQLEKPLGKQAELKRLSELHTRLEVWRKELPKEFEAKDGQLPQVFIMHMFYYLLFLHLFRPFLKYTSSNPPLPPHVSPRRHCISAAAAISKLLRLYKKTYGLRQICNIAVYIAHSACTIHLLNLQDKDSRRDFVHGLRHLEEISECWLCARRTLGIITQQVRKWEIDLPEDAQEVLDRADEKYQFSKRQEAHSETGSPAADTMGHPSPHQYTPDSVVSPSQMLCDDETSTGGVHAPFVPKQMTPQPQSRVRSPSAERRAELIRQMQQNSLQSHISSQAYAFNPSSSQESTWNVNAWKANSSSAPTTTGLAGTRPSLLNVKYAGNESQALPLSGPNSGMLSPSAVFGGQQAKVLLEEQKDWWLRDQLALFDHWMSKGESIGGSVGAGVRTGVTFVNGVANTSGMDVFADLNNSESNGVMVYGNAANRATLPPEWSGYDMAGNASYPNNGFGFDAGML